MFWLILKVRWIERSGLRPSSQIQSLIASRATLERTKVFFMPTRNVNVTEHLDFFIKAGINSGRFSNASEVVREGLRLLERREQEDQAKFEWLRTAAKDGFDAIERGDYMSLNSEKEIREEVSAELEAERTGG